MLGIITVNINMITFIIFAVVVGNILISHVSYTLYKTYCAYHLISRASAVINNTLLFLRPLTDIKTNKILTVLSFQTLIINDKNFFYIPSTYLIFITVVKIVLNPSSV